MTQRVLLFSLVLITLPGCIKQTPRQTDQSWLQKEARLHDVPVPLGSKPDVNFGQHISDDQIMLAFVLPNFNVEQAVQFYCQEMEQAGWREVILFADSGEVLLNFEKPQRFCSVSLRSEGAGLHVYLFVGFKK